MKRRKQLFVEPRLQGTLLKRVISHWMIFTLLLTLLLFIFHYFRSLVVPTENFWTEFLMDNAITYIVLIFVLPIFAYDTLKMSLRFAGPYARLGAALKKLAAGETVAPVKVRQGDFLSDFADSFNQIAVNQQRQEPSN